jgi:hypothetical protein
LREFKRRRELWFSTQNVHASGDGGGLSRAAEGYKPGVQPRSPVSSALMGRPNSGWPNCWQRQRSARSSRAGRPQRLLRQRQGNVAGEVRTVMIKERNDGEILGPRLRQKLRWQRGVAHTPETAAATCSVRQQHESQRPHLMMALGFAGTVGRGRCHHPRHAARGRQHGRAADEHASSRADGQQQ